MVELVVATTKGPAAPSFKYRVGAYCEKAEAPVPVLAVEPFPSRAEIAELEAHADGSAVLVLQRVLPSVDQARRLRSLFAAVVLDFDDAIYASPPRVGGSRAVAAAQVARRVVTRGSTWASSRSRPLRRLLPHVDLCVAGNSILGEFAAANGAPRVEVIPTTVEPLATAPEKPLRPGVAWVGMPANLQYLNLIARPLEQLHGEIGFDMTIVTESGRRWDEAPIPVRYVGWTEQAQREVLTGSTVGVSPLTDDPWTRGKCAHRSIVFAAHGLPAVATPVGMTDQVVLDGRTGVLARTEQEWTEGLRSFLEDRERAAEAGRLALAHVTAHYSHEAGIRCWEEVLRSVAGRAYAPQG